MHTRIGILFAATVVAGAALPRTPFCAAATSCASATPVPLAVQANDLRTPAGHIIDGALHVELDVVEMTWFPDGPKSPSAPGVAFAERGKSPQMPGPLLRMQTGTPVHLSVRNALTKAVWLIGLGDRTRGDTAVKGRPAFMSRAPLVLAPGEMREVTFTPTAAITSFYYGSVVEDSVKPPPRAPDCHLIGAFVVDPAGTTPPANERIFLISIAVGLNINGLSWPYTERLHYAEGDTVHWRVIDASPEYHPMHLHGFYFAVDTRGDAQTDTSIRAPRPLAVTEGMRPFSTMRLSWVAARPGNWLFHCHLLVHSQGGPPDSAVVSSHDDAMMDHSMAGLIMGITVTPRRAALATPPAHARRLDLWTGMRPRMFGDSVGYSFVLQRGETHPAADSIVMPGSPLVLTRGEPTHIVVHNRLPVALALHWHGMELQSYYDGVGHWSGAPGNTRAPIRAGDSMSVYITPPRAGTFMYHIHGESGAELQQGLYGALLVLEKGETFNATRERLFVLASRGATLDAEAAINGRALPPAEQFDVGKTYRLRFMHISTNDVKHVRLLKDGQPVRWRLLAQDGATLPVALRVPVVATRRMDVGQTFDVEWTPTAPGVYVLEVETDYLITAGTSMKRVAFAVGPVPAAQLRMAATGTSLPLADVPNATLGKLAGAYSAPGGNTTTELVSIWSVPEGLFMNRTTADVESQPALLIPLADGTFVPGTQDNGQLKEMLPLVHYRIAGSTLSIDADARAYTRLASLKLSDTTLARYAGAYEEGVRVELKDGTLVLSFPGGPPAPLMAISPSRFIADLGGATLLEFVSKDGKVVSLSAAGGAFTVARRGDK